ncbi:YgiQ family radical SAM protein [Pseudoramibacter alactolyticus]|uniref:YgiQ family radical SAM protein n=1 Tax=Pseudoramibacter alactolyticus TaxID=113287 RepID=UPI0028E54EA5|nr:YgiQ family radical SAM protein [Pseudoramibacter alactolyticus]
MTVAAEKSFPMTTADMTAFGWEQIDCVFVSGDAFVDHSSYGSVIIAGILKDRDYRVGMLAQPNWTDAEAFKIFGRPRLAFLVSSGNMDSMVCHYTVNRKRRHDDAYTPGGKTGRRPDRAGITYCVRIREAFGKVPIILGGIEASLRRFAHYDYWQDQVRRPILVDSSADLLVYGMGEKAIVEVAEALDAGLAIRDITYMVLLDHVPDAGIEISSFETVSADKKAFAKAAAIIYACNDPFMEVPYYQRCDHRVFVQNAPQMPLTKMEMDDVYDRGYNGRQWSPGPEVTSLGEVRFSVTANRGCFGSCVFCAIGMHQGQIVQRRSADSILKEARMMTELPAFKGYIHDVGGPTANFLRPGL